MVKTCNTRETHVIIRVLAVIKTWGDAVRRESLGVCHGQSTVIGRVLRVGITGNSVCLAAYHWQMDFCMLRQCFSSRTAGDGHTPYKARLSQKLTKITTCNHVHQIFITSFWFRRGVLCDRGLTLVRINAVMGCFHEQRDIWTKEQTRQGTESSISFNTSLCCGYVQWNHITIQSIITWYYIWWNNDVDQTMTSQRHSIPHPHRWAMECL